MFHSFRFVLQYEYKNILLPFEYLEEESQVRIQGGPGGPGPPLTLGFEAPKLSIFGPYLIFP